MNKSIDFNINVKNEKNKFIVDEFIRYYKYLYGSYTSHNKTSKEMYYKLATIKKVIDTISSYSKLIGKGEDLAHIKGIGDKTVGRINEIIKTGKLSEIIEKEKQYESVSELGKIYGIGPIKATMFFEKYNIKSIDDLIKAVEKKQITFVK
jgi:DNA polymerase/3'-5' exonuclease PolX